METGKATCFATPKDLEAFHRCKLKGMSDDEAFNYGDNGIGCWNDITAQDHEPMCAISPQHMVQYFGSKSGAKHQLLIVVSARTGKSVECKIADIMPNEENIKNAAIIDLNPASCIQLGFPVEGVSERITWTPKC